MALLEETNRVAAQFEYTDEDVNKAVKEFLRQMGRWNLHPPRVILFPRVASCKTI